jgi:thiosulfate/3-mercaptopyruvate sulfurtransferase
VVGTLGGAGVDARAAGAGLEATDAVGGAAAGSGAGAQAMKVIATSAGILEDSIGLPGAYAILAAWRSGGDGRPEHCSELSSRLTAETPTGRFSMILDEAKPARTNDLVDTEWLENALGDPALRVVEVDVSPVAYREGHIPGAVLWNVYKDLKDPDYKPVDREAIERILQASGITRESVVVFYGYAPAMGFWLMKLFGHPQARILNTNRATWQQEGRPWTTDTVKPPETRYRLPLEDERIRARQTAVEKAIGASGRVILDVRSKPEYCGERFWPSGGMEEGGRAGHIPTAAHVPIDGLQDEKGAFRPLADLRRQFAGIDLGDEQEIITYCTIGGRACTAWFVLSQLLRHERTRVYDGSWAEWGRLSFSPVES